MRLPPLVLVLLGLPPLGGCRSPESFRAEADREIYEIVRRRREELGAPAGFTIERPEGSLRERVEAGSQAAQEEPPVWTLVDCLRIAAENSRSYQDRRESLYLAALDLTLERWEFSIQETGRIGAFLEGDGDGARDAGVFSNLGIARLLASGAQVFADAGIQLVRDVGSGDGWHALSTLSLTITQPFLRGLGREVVREPLTQAEREVLYEARAYERFRRTFAFDVAARYYRLLEQGITLRNEEQNVERLAELRRRNESFAEAGRLSDIQVDQARQDELRGQSRVIEARRELEGMEDEFLTFLGLPLQTRFARDATELARLSAWESFEPPHGEEEAFALALRERLDHATALDRVEDAARRVRVSADALRAGLDLELGIDGTSPAGRPFDLEGDALSWSADLTLDLPLDRLPERNIYRQRLIGLAVAERAVEESGDRIRSQLRDAMRRHRSASRTYEIQRGAVLLAERRVESAKLSLEAGRASTRDVLEAQDDLVQAQNGLSRARTDLALAGLSYHRDMEGIRVSERGLSVVPLGAREEVQP